MSSDQRNLLTHFGGCHCGAVRFELVTSDQIEVFDCNCSICEMVGFEHLIVPASDFTLLSDESALRLYQFNLQIAKHYFCGTCGIKPFYIPRSNPDGVSVNFRCVQNPSFVRVDRKLFDGANFEANKDQLSYLSKNSSD